jgi:hypothetical protein
LLLAQEGRVLDVDEVLRSLPHFETFCSVARLDAQAEQLRREAGFTVARAGFSASGRPIHHVRFGTGRVKALVVGGAHAVEPIGSLTVYALLELLRRRTPALMIADVEWHIVPCIDPDGAILNEAWTQSSFDLDAYLRNFYLQPRAQQVDFSFPIRYKKLTFERPSDEALVLRRIIDEVRPYFFFSLHNYVAMGGSYCNLSRDLGAKFYEEIASLWAENGITTQSGTLSATERYAGGIYSLPTLRKAYDRQEALGLEMPDEFLTGKVGASSVDYLLEVKPDALAFIAELTYGHHPEEISSEPTDETIRQLKLRIFADNKAVAACILEEWEKIEEDLDLANPFYKKIESDLVASKSTLHEGVTEWYESTIQSILFNPKNSALATKAQRIQAHMNQAHFLGNASSFFRLLSASKNSERVQEARSRFEQAWSSALATLKERIDIARFRPYGCDALAKAQLGSGLIALNALLEAPTSIARDAS